MVKLYNAQFFHACINKNVPFLVPSQLEGVETHYIYMNLKKTANLQCTNVEKSSEQGVKWWVISHDM